jgi:prephenate dehydratase
LVGTTLTAYSALDVFFAVEDSSVSYGIVPFENSTNGSVLNTLDLLIDREKKTGNVLVCGEAYLPIHHCLLGHASRAPCIQSPPLEATSHGQPNSKTRRSRPLTDLSHITRILSHPQAFGQCDAFLSTYLKGVECQEVSSTSKAAEMAAADASGKSAAISSTLAAGIYGPDILADGIQDRDDNTTRFFLLHRGNISGELFNRPKPVAGGMKEVKWKTMVAFRVNHQASGALAAALLSFKPYNLNLTSINSRPSRLRPWHYIFLVEFQGKRELDGTGPVNHALEELSRSTGGWRWLGSWIDQMECS